MCFCTLIDANGTIVWSNDPSLVAASRSMIGLYRLRFSTDVRNDVLVVQPRPEHDDVPRSLLAWPLQTGERDVDVRIDAHFVTPGPAPHDHRRDLDMRFSVLRCAREAVG